MQEYATEDQLILAFKVYTMKFMKIAIIFIACFWVGYTVNSFLLHLPLFSTHNAIVILAMTATTVSVLY